MANFRSKAMPFNNNDRHMACGDGGGDDKNNGTVDWTIVVGQWHKGALHKQSAIMWHVCERLTWNRFACVFKGRDRDVSMNYIWSWWARAHSLDNDCRSQTLLIAWFCVAHDKHFTLMQLTIRNMYGWISVIVCERRATRFLCIFLRFLLVLLTRSFVCFHIYISQRLIWLIYLLLCICRV